VINYDRLDDVLCELGTRHVDSRTVRLLKDMEQAERILARMPPSYTPTFDVRVKDYEKRANAAYEAFERAEALKEAIKFIEAFG
jgi:2-C-methyl-D-erythritol 4-phosphate cytidylyltransferase